MNSQQPQRIGTRGSELALAQATETEALLRAAFPERGFERTIIRTTGDARTDVSLSEVVKAEGTFDKGVFIKELELALDDGGIDIAVHSLKDLPTTLDPRFALAAVLPRSGVRDLLVSLTPVSLLDLPPGSRVGTSSVRRARQVLHLRPDLTVCDIRGNVPTRLAKLHAGDAFDAILLAEAGLIRLGMLPETSADDSPEAIAGFPGLFATRLAEETFLPAAGQGAIGLEIRADDAASRVFCETIGDADTLLRVTAEREFLRLLNAGCHTPVGVSSLLADGLIHLKAIVFPESDGSPRTGSAEAADPFEAAALLYQSLS
jgi:hydroxymethylbilane synthase